MAGFEHVIFDVDGTLADTDGISQQALQDLLFERTGEEEDRADLVFARGIPGAEALERLGILSEDALARWDELARAHADEYEAVIAPLGIDGFFSGMVLAEDAELHKPNPEPLLEYLRRTGAKPEKTIYVGDTEYDSVAARATGVSFVIADWGAASYVESAAIGCTRRPRWSSWQGTRSRRPRAGVLRVCRDWRATGRGRLALATI